jgi:hypothetical protein
MNCQKWKEIRSDIEYALHGTGKQEQRSPSSLWSHEPYPMNIACRSEAFALRSTAQPPLLQIPGSARSFKYQDRPVSSDSNRRGCQLSITKPSAHAPVSRVRGFRMGGVPRTRCSMSITRTSPPTRMRSCLTCWAGDPAGVSRPAVESGIRGGANTVSFCTRIKEWLRSFATRRCCRGDLLRFFQVRGDLRRVG